MQLAGMRNGGSGSRRQVLVPGVSACTFCYRAGMKGKARKIQYTILGVPREIDAIPPSESRAARAQP
jgi:hypothetical protein